MTTIRIRDVSLFVKVTGKGYPLVLMGSGRRSATKSASSTSIYTRPSSQFCHWQHEKHPK
jgi:hypothetical protein